jgi:ankyrin repeat protein
VNAKGIDGTPLNFAVRNGHIEIVEYLILKGANVNSLSEENNIIETPLDYTLNAYENAVDLAKEEGISLSKEGAQHGQIASMLERFGGKRAIEVSIHAAADFGDVWSVKKFIAKGIDVNSKSVTEHTPLDYALKEKSWNTPKEKAARKETADLLRKHGGKTGEELKAEGK